MGYSVVFLDLITKTNVHLFSVIQDNTAPICSVNIKRELLGANPGPGPGTGFKCPQHCQKRANAIVAVVTRLGDAKTLLFRGANKPAICLQGAPQGDLWIHPGPGSGHRAL